MISQVSFQNFKSLKSTTLTLERITVIVGANASGKSSILEGLHILSRAATTNLREVFQDRSLLPSFYTRGESGELILQAQGERGGIRLRALPSINPTVAIDPEREIDWSVHLDARTSTNDDWQSMEVLPDGQKILSSSAYLKLDPSRMRAPSYSPSPRPRFEEDGTGFPSVLAYMALNQPDSFQKILNDLRAIIPSVERIRFDRLPLLPPQSAGGAVGESLIFDFDHASSIPAYHVSEGTLVTLGLLAGFHSPSRPKLFLLDDLDRALHPKAQRTLVNLIRQFVESNPDIQVIATTHSPYLLDAFKAEEVRLCSFDSQRGTMCKELSSHPEFERWKDEMAPGELWSMVGEQWEATQNGEPGS